MPKRILTKEEVIDYHREMWSWIAKLSEEDIKKYNRISTMLNYFCKHNDILHGDPCCCYDQQIKTLMSGTQDCMFCPIRWGTENKCRDVFCSAHGKGYYSLISDAFYAKDYLKVKEIALIIANLPEKIDDNYQNKNKKE